MTFILESYKHEVGGGRNTVGTRWKHRQGGGGREGRIALITDAGTGERQNP